MLTLNVTMNKHYTDFTFSDDTTGLDLTKEMQGVGFVKTLHQEIYMIDFGIFPAEYTIIWQDLLTRVRINFYFYHNNTNKL